MPSPRRRLRLLLLLWVFDDGDTPTPSRCKGYVPRREDVRALVNPAQATLGVGNSLCREALHSNGKHIPNHYSTSDRFVKQEHIGRSPKVA